MDDTVKAAEMKFLASGREDMDVRMLGFALQCLRKTLSQEELLELEHHSNSHHAGWLSTACRLSPRRISRS